MPVTIIFVLLISAVSGAAFYLYRYVYFNLNPCMLHTKNEAHQGEGTFSFLPLK